MFCLILVFLWGSELLGDWFGEVEEDDSDGV